MTEPSDLRAVIDRYTSAVSAGDRAGFVSLFTDDCEVIDPYPATRYVGREGVERWWDTLIAPMSNVRVDIREHHTCGDRVAIAYTTTGSPDPSTTVQLSGIDIFTIVDGRIAAMEAYWDPTTVEIVAGSA